VVFLFIFFKKHNRLSHFSINFAPKNTKRHFAFFSIFKNFLQFQTAIVFNFTRKSFLRKAIFSIFPLFCQKKSFILIILRTRAHARTRILYYVFRFILRVSRFQLSNPHKLKTQREILCVFATNINANFLLLLLYHSFLLSLYVPLPLFSLHFQILQDFEPYLS